MPNIVTNTIKTKASRGLIIFSSIMLLTSLAFFIAFIIINENVIVKAVILIMTGLFSIVSALVLFDQLFDYVLLKDGKIISRFFFSKKVANISDITSIRATKDTYEVLVKERKFCTLSLYAPETQKMFFQFEKYGVDISKIKKN